MDTIYTKVESYNSEPDNWSWNLSGCVTRKHSKGYKEILWCLSRIGFTDFRRYARDYFKQCRIDVLVQGNMSRKEAISITNNIVKKVGWSKIDDVSAMR